MGQKEITFAFKLTARKSNSYNTKSNRTQTDYWIVDAKNNRIVKNGCEANIALSCSVVKYREKTNAFGRGTGMNDESQILVSFAGNKLADRYFTKISQDTIEFLKLLKAI